MKNLVYGRLIAHYDSVIKLTTIEILHCVQNDGFAIKIKTTQPVVNEFSKKCQFGNTICAKATELWSNNR